MKPIPTALLLTAIAAAPLTGAAAADQDVCADAWKRYEAFPAEAKAPPGTEVVLMYQYTFCPEQITVKPGTTVRWINVERTSHSIWFKEAGEPESDRVFLEEGWDFTFQAPGEYPYLCGPHWEQNDMVGKVVVTE